MNTEADDKTPPASERIELRIGQVPCQRCRSQAGAAVIVHLISDASGYFEGYRICESCLSEATSQLHAAPAPESSGPPDLEIVQGLLELVDHSVPLEELQRRSPKEIEEAETWAGCVHLAASDNIIDVPPRPGWVAPFDNRSGILGAAVTFDQMKEAIEGSPLLKAVAEDRQKLVDTSLRKPPDGADDLRGFRVVRKTRGEADGRQTVMADDGAGNAIGRLYPKGWPTCPGCGLPALDGHITCGDVDCNEAQYR